ALDDINTVTVIQAALPGGLMQCVDHLLTIDGRVPIKGGNLDGDLKNAEAPLGRYHRNNPQSAIDCAPGPNGCSDRKSENAAAHAAPATSWRKVSSTCHISGPPPSASTTSPAWSRPICASRVSARATTARCLASLSSSHLRRSASRCLAFRFFAARCFG